MSELSDKLKMRLAFDPKLIPVHTILSNGDKVRPISSESARFEYERTAPLIAILLECVEALEVSCRCTFKIGSTNFPQMELDKECLACKGLTKLRTALEDLP